MEMVTYLYKKARSLLEERIFRDIIIIDFEDEKRKTPLIQMDT